MATTRKNSTKRTVSDLKAKTLKTSKASQVKGGGLISSPLGMVSCDGSVRLSNANPVFKKFASPLSF